MKKTYYIVEDYEQYNDDGLIMKTREIHKVNNVGDAEELIDDIASNERRLADSYNGGVFWVGDEDRKVWNLRVYDDEKTSCYRFQLVKRAT